MVSVSPDVDREGSRDGAEPRSCLAFPCSRRTACPIRTDNDGMPGSEHNERLVRRLRPTDRDLDQIVEQINSASMEIDEPFTRDSLTGFLRDNRNVYLTVHVQGELAGTLHAIGYIHPAGQRYLYVDEVDTDESFRRQGVATALMRAAQEIAREMAATAVWLGAESANDAAHALYRSLGPQEVEPGVIYTYTIDPSNDKHGGA